MGNEEMNLTASESRLGSKPFTISISPMVLSSFTIYLTITFCSISCGNGLWVFYAFDMLDKNNRLTMTFDRIYIVI